MKKNLTKRIKRPGHQLLAIIPSDIAKVFKKKLIDDEFSYKEWLLKRIEAYTKGEKL